MSEEQDQIDEQESLVKTSVSLPRYIYDWMRETAKRPLFNSQSAVMVVALSELKGKMDCIAENKPGMEPEIMEGVMEEIRKVSLDAVTAIRKAAVSNENSTVLLLNLLTTHEELIEEINNQIILQRNRRPGDTIIE